MVAGDLSMEIAIARPRVVLCVNSRSVGRTRHPTRPTKRLNARRGADVFRWRHELGLGLLQLEF
jgi:hypothetical protein